MRVPTAEADAFSVGDEYMETPSRSNRRMGHRSSFLKSTTLVPVTCLAVLVCVNIYYELQPIVGLFLGNYPSKSERYVEFRGTVISVSSDYITSFAEYQDSGVPKEQRIQLRKKL